MKLLRIIGILAYSSVAGYLIYLLFWGLVNLMVWANLGWIGIIACVVLFMSTIFSIVGGLSSLIGMPLLLLRKDDLWMGYFAIPALALYGYLSISMIWEVVKVYNAKTIIQSGSLSIIALVVFISLIQVLVNKIK